MIEKHMNKTYMRGVSDWDFIVTKRKEENYYLCIKRINEIDRAFIVEREGKKTVFMDNGYYVMEFTPIGKFYNGRAFLDKEANVIGYYFDMTLENGVKDNIPYYDDLYLDVWYNRDGTIQLEDEDELLEALQNKEITKEQYDLANRTCSGLVQEIKENKNMFINMDKKEIIQKYFNN